MGTSNCTIADHFRTIEAQLSQCYTVILHILRYNWSIKAKKKNHIISIHSLIHHYCTTMDSYHVKGPMVMMNPGRIIKVVSSLFLFWSQVELIDAYGFLVHLSSTRAKQIALNNQITS